MFLSRRLHTRSAWQLRMAGASPSSHMRQAAGTPAIAAWMMLVLFCLAPVRLFCQTPTPHGVAPDTELDTNPDIAPAAIHRAAPAIATKTISPSPPPGVPRTAPSAEADSMPELEEWLETDVRLVSAERPRLTVVLCLDGFRAEYLDRFSAQFGPSGFHRLLREGYRARDCRHAQAVTQSAVGHSILLTGAYPNRTGIVGDAWYSRGEGRRVTCVEDAAARVVAVHRSKEPRTGAGAEALLSPTLACMLRAATHGRARVASLAMEDSAAMLSVGPCASLVLWWDGKLRQFVTSSAYARQQPAWVVLFNDLLRHRLSQPVVWELLLPAAAYSISGMDDAPGEAAWLGRTFPHTAAFDATTTNGAILGRFLAHPVSDSILFELAEKAIAAEQLGRDEIPDLLCVSFPAMKHVGRAYGPHSWEVHDLALRTDLLVARFLDLLDLRIGTGEYAVVVTSGHGMAALPETLAAAGQPSGRVNPELLAAGANAHLQTLFPPRHPEDARDWIACFLPPWFSLDEETARARNIQPRVAREALRAWLAAQPHIAAAYSDEQLAVAQTDARAAAAPVDSLAAAFARARHPGRSGDIAIALRPGWIFSTAGEGTETGSPYRHDQAVPLLLYGKGIARGIAADEPVAPVDIAATLAALLGVEAPPDCEGRLLPGCLIPPTSRP